MMGMGMMGMEMMGGPGGPGGFGGPGGPGGYGPPGGFGRPGRPGRPGGRAGRGRSLTTEQEVVDEKAAGFVVIIEGCTPHKNGFGFLNPPEPGLDRKKWGFFDQLRYIGKPDKAIAKKDKTGKVITPIPADEHQEQASLDAQKLLFESYVGKGEPELYFDTSQSDWISGSPKSEQPIGLGIPKPKETTITTGRYDRVGRAAPRGRQAILPVLVDPLTFEPISDTNVFDENGEPKYDSDGNPLTVHNDTWFRVKLKIKLKNQPAVDSDKQEKSESKKR